MGDERTAEPQPTYQRQYTFYQNVLINSFLHIQDEMHFKAAIK